MPPSWLIFVGAILAATGVALGALGAHALQARLTPQQLESFRTAVQYQMLHALGLVLIGVLSLAHRGPWFNLAGWLMLVGIVLFSGFIYAWLATGVRGLVHVVPVGGLAFILAWIVLAIGALLHLPRSS
jgi:uncharacterized membrane protein YgdD (TMEM256/DUF423 family)